MVKFTVSDVPDGEVGIVQKTKSWRYHVGGTYVSVLEGSSSRVVSKPTALPRRSSRKQMTVGSVSHEDEGTAVLGKVFKAANFQGLSASDPVDINDLDYVTSLIGMESFVKREESEVNITEMDHNVEISGSSLGPKVHFDSPVGKAGSSKRSSHSDKAKGRPVEPDTPEPSDENQDQDEV